MSATCLLLAVACLAVGGFVVFAAMAFLESCKPPKWEPPVVPPVEDTLP